jgi:hypothetical protein
MTASSVFEISNVAAGSTRVQPHLTVLIIPAIVPEVWQNNTGKTIVAS